MTHSPIRLRDVARFWLPLSLNWQLMAIEGPFIAALVSNLPESKLNLAAFSVAFAWSLIIESPVMGLLSVSSALSRDLDSFRALRSFMWIINAITTAIMLAFLSPWGFSIIANDVLHLDPLIASRAHSAAMVMILWPALIGFRRFYQGVSIAAGRPKLVAFGTVIRLASMAVTGVVLARLGLPGAVVGCGALIGAVGSEAAAAWMFAQPSVRMLATRHAEAVPTLKSIFHLYFPLMVTIFLGMALHPLATFALGRLNAPVESLAAYQVLGGAWFFFSASTLGIQETTIALMTRTHAHARPILRRFAWIYGLAASIALGIFVYSGVADWWYSGIGSLPSEVRPLLLWSLSISIAFPLLRSWECYQRGMTVWARRTEIATGAAVLELFVIAAVVPALGWGTGWPGALVVACAIPLGILAAVAYLWFYIERPHV